MKIEEIRELAQIMKENGLGVLELQEDGTSLRLETACATAPVVQAVVPAAAPAAPAPGSNSSGNRAGWDAGGLQQSQRGQVADGRHVLSGSFPGGGPLRPCRQQGEKGRCALLLRQ